jgi:hypothetical protein
MELRNKSDLADFAAGRHNQYAVWTRTLDSFGDVTPDGEYLIRDIPSGSPLSLEFYRIDLSEVQTLDVAIGVRTWTFETDGFADDHSFSARVELYDGDTRVDSFPLFEAHGETLDLLDAGPNGEPTNFHALIAAQDATAAQIVVEVVYGGGSDYYVVSSLAASASDLTSARLGDGRLDWSWQPSPRRWI